MKSRYNPSFPLLIFGVFALLVALLSISDMFRHRPYDGVILETGGGSRELVVKHVLRGSGAARAGIRPGEEIVGIGREALRDAAHAARRMLEFHIGDEVAYLIRGRGGVREVTVKLDRRRVGDGAYAYACLLGLSFFFIGVFVLVRQPRLRASQVFFILCGLFMLLLVCRMRPPSYSGIDNLVLGMGTLAFLFLPPTFLHFYSIFPQPAWQVAARQSRHGRRLVALWRHGWPWLYAFPLVVYLISLLGARWGGLPARLINGAPAANWWLLALYMLLGLGALLANSQHLREARERRGVILVLLGSIFGLLPFLASAVLLSPRQHTQSFFLYGIMPLVLVPITFTYAIVRFELLEIRVILRRSLLYTVTTALVTGVYAGAIAAFNVVFTGLAASRYSPLLLALAIVLFFEPVRRRMQGPIDRFFFASTFRLRQAMVDLGEALSAQHDLRAVVQELMQRLPKLLDLEFAALYLVRGERLVRKAGPSNLPAEIPRLAELQKQLERRARITRLDQLAALALRSERVASLLSELEASRVEALGVLTSRRRQIGVVLLSRKRTNIPFEREELNLIQGLLHQAGLALETSLLLEERTQQAELERELEIAASVQARLLPDQLQLSEGWDVAAACRPAREVGGDFFAQIPGPEEQQPAVVFGDVAGKSVSGALMMMAAHEVLHALALSRPHPDLLFTLANRRLYALGKRNFVALGYIGTTAGQSTLRYLLAGQPPLILRRAGGTVEELPLPSQRLPLGAMEAIDYRCLEVTLRPGDVVLGYSDGVSEALSPAGELFGYDRLIAAVEASSGHPEEVIDRVMTAVDGFSAGGVQSDDMTLVAIACRREKDR